MKKLSDIINKSFDEPLQDEKLDNGYDAGVTTGTHISKKKVEAKYGSLLVMPRTYTSKELIKRMKNSSAFDKASYAADGGDSWIDPRRKEFFDKPNGVDKELWEQAKNQSIAVFGERRWQFQAWAYKKLGGRFT